jgi:hypothetical protein
MYKENNLGDNIPPCRTQLLLLKCAEVDVRHITQNSCQLYQMHNNLTTNRGTPRLARFSNSDQ